MAKVTMKLPVGLTYPDGQKEVECEGATVGAALASVVSGEPRLKSRIFREDGAFGSASSSTAATSGSSRAWTRR